MASLRTIAPLRHSAFKMNDISLGAVGAALIAGLFSFWSLVLGKEQKISEFRQAWINDLRACLISYLVNINMISDLVRVKAKGEAIDASKLVESYSALNTANHGISLRVNPSEKPAKRLLQAMRAFEDLAADNSSLTPDNIKKIEKSFVKESRRLLKFEWSRVKRGESMFFWTKWVMAAITLFLVVLFVFAWISRPASLTMRDTKPQRSASSTIHHENALKVLDTYVKPQVLTARLISTKMLFTLLAA